MGAPFILLNFFSYLVPSNKILNDFNWCGIFFLLHWYSTLWQRQSCSSLLQIFCVSLWSPHDCMKGFQPYLHTSRISKTALECLSKWLKLVVFEIKFEGLQVTSFSVAYIQQEFYKHSTWLPRLAAPQFSRPGSNLPSLSKCFLSTAMTFPSKTGVLKK